MQDRKGIDAREDGGKAKDNADKETEDIRRGGGKYIPHALAQRLTISSST